MKCLKIGMGEWTWLVGLLAVVFAACGDGSTTEKVTEVVLSKSEVVSSVEDLPKCERSIEGERILVKGESSVRVCVDGLWYATVPTARDSVSADENFFCYSEELDDSTGFKVVCNGDSIGVVLNGLNGVDGPEGEKGRNGKNGSNGKNGAKGDTGDSGNAGENGKKGADGEGCTIVDQSDSTVKILCDGEVIELKGFAHASVELDSEKVAIALDSLTGLSQKGPFLKGATVYLYELSDGRTLKQTNGNFVSYITRDDGRYKFASRDLVSQYALVVVDGEYRNEVTGVPSKASIKLRAVTNMLMRKSVNVNLLTHLEYDRVYYLVTHEKMTVRAAKRMAQSELMNIFDIDATDFKTESEDMDVFGKTDADAALLAVSVLLQGDRTEAEMVALLAEIASDMEQDGEWNDETTKRKLVDWALRTDLTGRLIRIRNNVAGWKLSETVPDFEKYLRGFWQKELNVGKCSKSMNGDTLELKGSDLSVQSLKCVDGAWRIHRIRDLRDGNVYRVTTIENQLWMAENMRYVDSVGYPALQGRMKCFSTADSIYKYGCHYTWSVAMDSAAVFSDNAKGCGRGNVLVPTYPVRGICPEGFHLPDSLEWIALFEATGNNTVALLSDEIVLADISPSYADWDNPTDEYGMTIYLANYYDYSGEYRSFGTGASFWTSAQNSYAGNQSAYRFYVYPGSPSTAYLNIYSNEKINFHSIRCVLGLEE